MICAGKGGRVIANIWNGSLDKRNICTMRREKQTEEQKSKRVRERKEKEKRETEQMKSSQSPRSAVRDVSECACDWTRERCFTRL